VRRPSKIRERLKKGLIMKIQITGRHLEITPTLKEYIKSRLDKIEKYHFKISEAQVILEVEKYRHHAEITLFLDGSTMIAEEETEEMYSTIDKAVGKLEKQVKKYKEKLTDHRPRKSVRTLPGEPPAEPRPFLKIVKEKTLALKPVSREKAIIEMESLQKDFFIYMDDEERNINVLYRRKNGDLGNILCGI